MVLTRCSCRNVYGDEFVSFSLQDVAISYLNWVLFPFFIFYFFAALIRHGSIKACRVSEALPCPVWISWFVGTISCSWAKGVILPLAWTWQAPHPCLLPSPCGYVYLGTGTQQLGRSLPLSGCLACPGLEAIVICYCSGRGKGSMGELYTASRHHLSLPPLSLALLLWTSVLVDFYVNVGVFACKWVAATCF